MIHVNDVTSIGRLLNLSPINKELMMQKVIIQNIRKYANAVEMAVQDEDTPDAFGGWADIIKQDTDLLKMVRTMLDNKDNDEGRKIAVLLCKHKKPSVRWLADLVMERACIEVEDRLNISL